MICVLGMHRSGTSCLTGTLQLAGLELGPHSTWNRFNVRGNRENPEIDRFHDDVLAANGGRWDDPPARVEWHARHRQWAARIVAEYPTDRSWGFKDPKTLPALTGWQELLGGVRYVGIHRHPVAVARSLMQRNGMAFDRAVSLWRHYNALLLAEWDRNPFPLLSFDWHEETFHEKLNRVLPELGLEPLGPGAARFFTAELRHHRGRGDGEHPPLQAEVEALHRRLLERTV